MARQGSFDFEEQPDFDGHTYVHEFDYNRLSGQLRRVFLFMKDCQWHTLAAVAEAARGSEAGASARIRDLRKDKFGGHRVESKRISGGLWVYRIAFHNLVDKTRHDVTQHDKT